MGKLQESDPLRPPGRLWYNSAMDVCEQIVGLIRETSSSLPEDVERALRAAARREAKGSSAAVVLKTILDNCKLARREGTPLCQDTGTLTFFVDVRLRRKVTPAVLKKAVARATELGFLRKNCIDSVTGKSHDDNCAVGAPVMHYVDNGSAGTPRPTITLIMKGGGSENMSRQYSLPDATLGAGRDLAGVRRCVLDAVQKTQGYGCAPGILGVCVGGDRATGYEAAKEQLLRPLDEAADDSFSTTIGVVVPQTLRALEKKLLAEANTLGIGPMGLGGKTTLLGVKLAARPRVPASFFVTVAYLCWAARRRTIEL